MKHPDTAQLAREALESTGLKHQPFADLICVGLRTLRAWLAGEKPAPPIAQMVLREVKGGWRPARTEAGFLVYSEETREWALPERAGWTSERAEAGLYTEDRADKAAETMLDGQRHAISLIEAGGVADLAGRLG